MKQMIRSADAPPPVGPYSQAVAANGFLFLSGQIPLDASGRLVEGDVAAQTEQVLKNLAAVLAAAGSSLGQVVKTTVYLKDLGDFARMNEVYARYFAAEPPARATVEAPQRCARRNRGDRAGRLARSRVSRQGVRRTLHQRMPCGSHRNSRTSVGCWQQSHRPGL